MSKLRLECVAFKDLEVEKLYEIIVLRQNVFIVEQNCVFLEADGKDINAWHCLGYNEENKLMACTRLFAKHEYYPEYQSIGRVASSSENRGKGYGRAIFEYSIAKLDELFGNEPIKIGAQKYLEAFYNSFGFISEGEMYIEDGIEHIIMVKKLNG